MRSPLSLALFAALAALPGVAVASSLADVPDGAPVVVVTESPRFDAAPLDVSHVYVDGPAVELDGDPLTAYARPAAPPAAELHADGTSARPRSPHQRPPDPLGTYGAGLFGFLAAGLTLFDYLRVHRGKCAGLVYTAPNGGVKGGAVVVIGAQLGIVSQDTAEGADVWCLTEAPDPGLVMPKAGVTIVKGSALYWDADGSPVGGVALSGAVTNITDSGANKLLGYALAGAGGGDKTVRFRKVAITA